MRSHAAASRCWASPSPPPMPTLLWSTSMRPSDRAHGDGGGTVVLRRTSAGTRSVATLGDDQCRRLGGRVHVPIHGEHPCALPREEQCRRPAVPIVSPAADRPRRRGRSWSPASRREPRDAGIARTPNERSAIDTSWYWPTAKTRSMTCWVDHDATNAAHVSSETQWWSMSSSTADRRASPAAHPGASTGPVSRAMSASSSPLPRPIKVC